MKQLSKHWSDSLFWLACNLSGIVIPVVLGIIFSVAMKFGFSLGTITSGGQFALYSIAMLVITFHLLMKASQRRLPSTQGFGLAFLLTFFLALAAFILAVLAQNGADIAAWIIQWPTIILFVICVAVTFFAVVADNRRMERNISDFKRTYDSSATSLNDKFGSTN